MAQTDSDVATERGSGAGRPASGPPASGAAASRDRAAPRGTRSRRGIGPSLRESLTGYALLAPALFGVAAFLLVPIGVLIWLSFNTWNLLGPITPAGVDNWVRVFQTPAVWNSFGVTLLYVALVIPLQTALGIFLGNLLARDLPGTGAFRTILVLPWVCAPLVLGVVWEWMLRPDGVVADWLGFRIEWLTNPSTVMLVLAFVTIWSNVGYITLFFMAGLANISPAVIEAARVDGANDWQIFWRIKLPLLMPTTFFVLVTSVIGSFQAFDLVFSLAPNQPATDLIAIRIYNQMMEANDVGLAAVLALMLFAVLIVITLVQNAYFSKRMTYDQ